MDPTRAPGRKYRRRHHGEPVNPEWTALQQPGRSFASPPPYVTSPPPYVSNPLAGVVGEAWREYRRHAARLLPLATAGIVVAFGATELVRLVAGRFDTLVALLLEVPTAWLAGELIEFLLGAVAVGVIHGTRPPDGVDRPAPARLRECLGEVTGAWLAASFAVLGGLVLFVIPGVYLMTMWVACVPVIVIERAGPLAALGRSRELVSGHGWTVFGCFLLLSVPQTIASYVLRAAFSGCRRPGRIC